MDIEAERIDKVKHLLRFLDNFSLTIQDSNRSTVSMNISLQIGISSFKEK